MKSLFVTGNDTDVGKTCVTASIVKNLRDMDIDVGVMKPFASGHKKNSNSLSQDVDILMKYSGSHDPIDLVNPYFFEIPTSPYDASKILARKISTQKVIDAYDRLLSSHDLVIVEGIGGLMTPITQNYFVSNLISELDIDTIIVTGSKLGTVNHTLLTYEHCKQMHLKLKGFVINQTEPNGYELSNLKQQIMELTNQIVYCTIPYHKNFDLSLYVDNFIKNFDISNFGFKYS
jgi:dethiobiotin synthetase|tara:strand:+ start:463 stop:1158 length:696 start_codon:yes stop_codon:yes gene_type:complete